MCETWRAIAQLVVKLTEPRVVGGAWRQELQRDRLIEDQVVGPIDLAHAALAEQRHEAIAPERMAPGANETVVAADTGAAVAAAVVTALVSNVGSSSLVPG